MKVEFPNGYIPRGYEPTEVGVLHEGDLYLDMVDLSPKTWKNSFCSSHVHIKLKEKEPEYRPLQGEELFELFDYVLKSKGSNIRIKVTKVEADINKVYAGDLYLNAEYLLKFWQHLDGSPIGKRIT